MRRSTALLVRLRWAMWTTSMARSPLHLASSILGGIAALAVLAVLGPGIALLAAQDLRVRALTVPFFAFLTLMWGVLSLVATGVDNVLDPARFSVLPVRARQLAAGLLAAAYTGIPAIMLCGLALAQVVAWSGQGSTLAASLVAAVLGTLTAVLLSRAVTSLLARVMRGRIGRMVGASVIALATLLPLALNVLLTTSGVGTDLRRVDLSGSARTAAWTPVGWAWGLPFDIARGEVGLAAVHLGLSLALVVGLWLVWVAQLRRSLTSPLVSSGGQRIGAGRWLPHLLGHSPVATVAARRLRAWYRDSRMVGIALRTAVLPVFFILQAVLTDVPGLAGAGVVSLAVFAGLTLMNDLAFDGPAWWLHLVVGVPGWVDRLGRALASTLLFGPMVLVGFVVAASLGVIGAVLPWASVVLAAFLASLGLAVAVGAVLPGTAPRTGGNPFAATSGGAAQGCLTALISFVGPVLLTLPIGVLAVAARGSSAGRWATLAVAGLYGAGLLSAGVVLGGRRLDSHGPELLAQLGRAQL